MNSSDQDRRARRLGPLGAGGPDADESVDWEIEHYLAERVDRLVAEGWEADAAREEAERRFGSMERYRGHMTRIERRRMRMERMGGVFEFLRDAVAGTARTIRRSPGFALGVILTLGLGLGVNAAMFGIVDRLLLRPPEGIVAPEEVRLVGHLSGEPGESSPRYTLTYPDILELEGHTGLAGVAAYGSPADLTVGSGPEAESVRARLVSHDFFDLLGVEPARGRWPTVEEDRVGAAGTVLLSWGHWQRRYGGDTEMLGQTLIVAGRPHAVIGIVPRGVTGVSLDPVDLWLPMAPTQTALSGSSEWRESRYWSGFRAVVRLGDPAAEAAALEQATRIYRNAGGIEMFQARRAERNERLELATLAAASATDEARVVRWLLGVASIVLLIACANVANLFLARGSRRRREVAVRLAMGVSRRRLVAGMGLEAVLLALLGGASGLVLARWGAEGFRTMLLPNVLFVNPVGGRVLLFTVAISLLAGLLAGLGPSLQATRLDLRDAMSEGSRGASASRGRLRGGLVVAQTALSVVLLVGAGLFVRSLDTARSLDLGLDVDRLLLARLELAAEDPTSRETTDVYLRAVQRASTVPGVEAVALTQAPLGWSFARRIQVPGVDSLPSGSAYYWAVDPDYLETVGLRLEAGRFIEPSDTEESTRVAVVSRHTADAVWGGDAAIGQCIQIALPDGEPPCTEIVGIAEDAARSGLNEDPFLAYYVPIRQWIEEDRAAGLYLRTAGDPGELAQAVALALRSFSPAVRFARVEPLRSVIDPQARAWTLGATLFSLFGLLAVVVAAFGLYSLLAFDVAERRRELGIRMALGATARRLLVRVVGNASRLVVAGVIVGLAASWMLAPRIDEMLFDVEARDPLVLGAVAAALGLVGVVASLLPARRATRIDPMEALRAE